MSRHARTSRTCIKNSLLTAFTVVSERTHFTAFHAHNCFVHLRHAKVFRQIVEGKARCSKINVPCVLCETNARVNEHDHSAWFYVQHVRDIRSLLLSVKQDASKICFGLCNYTRHQNQRDALYVSLQCLQMTRKTSTVYFTQTMAKRDDSYFRFIILISYAHLYADTL